jgi:hypothetical protein
VFRLIYYLRSYTLRLFKSGWIEIIRADARRWLERRFFTQMFDFAWCLFNWFDDSGREKRMFVFVFLIFAALSCIWALKTH